MSSNQYVSSKNHLFELLDDILYFPEISIDKVEFFKWELQFLDYFLIFQIFTDEPDMLEVTQNVQTLFQNAVVDFSELQNQILLAKMEIKAKYSFPNVALLVSANKDGIAFLKFITEFVHSVAENLPELEKIDVPYSFLYFPETKEHIQDVLRELELLRNFACFVSDRFVTEPQSQHHDVTAFFSHVLSVAGHAAMLFWLYLPELAPEEIHVLLSDFLQRRIKPIQPCIRKIYVDVLQSLRSTILHSGWCPHIQNEHAEVDFLETILHNLVKLPSNINCSQFVALKDQLVIFQKMLNLLRANINLVPVQDVEFLLRDIDIVIIDVGILVYSLYNDHEEKEVMAPGKVNMALDLTGNIQHTNTVICLTIRKAFQSNLPRIHGLGYVDFLLNNLKEFQARYADSLAYVKNQLQIIQKEFERLQPFLVAVAEERHNDLNKIQRCATQLIGKAYEVEYIVDACISKEAPIWCLERWLLDIIEEITLIREEVAEIHEKKMVGDATNRVIAHTSSDLSRLGMNEEIVGFEDVIEQLRDQLIKGHKGIDVIAVVGMPGLGKTILSYTLYSDSSVVSHFDIRAQCCVSQAYSRKNVLLAILQGVVGVDPKLTKMHADDLADELRKALLPKRYLILIDDVWEACAWDDLKGCFQEANKGSRIILTTRSHEVANYARFQSEPFPLRMFTDDESLELLRKTVFGTESCPPHLTNIGQQIAEKCGQLPLSVVLVAGILAKEDKKEESWKKVATDLGPHIHKDSWAIIERSYQILPYHLRSCFLYFGAFPEDSVINVSKLIRLWISEGFIKSCEGKSLEDIARGYLENLIGRNLVMETKRSSGGKIKACHLHDLLHDFCKERAKEENLLLSIQWTQKSNTSSRVDCRKQLAHRMSIYGKGRQILEWSSCWSHVGSLILHNRCLSSDVVSQIFCSFKFLKVLDLGVVYIDSFPSNLDLVYLRYFSARTRDLSILSSMTTCWNVETLLLYNIEEGTLPITLLEMVKLRHLHISKCNSTVLENSKKLDSLITLSTPKFSSVQDAELTLRKTPNLRELRCGVEGTLNFHHYCVLNFPTLMETLKVKGSFPIFPFCISAPNLRNLTLYGFILYPRHLSEMGLLPNLQVLKLQRIVIWKKGWKVKNGKFPELKVLKLDKVCIPGKWIVDDDAFPNLERLVLNYCYDLKKIPSCFGEMSSLKSIEVKGCGKSISESARDIREIQVEDYQNSGFHVSMEDNYTSYSDSDDDDNNGYDGVDKKSF